MRTAEIQPVSSVRWTSNLENLAQPQPNPGAAIALLRSDLAATESASRSAAGHESKSLASLHASFDRGMNGSFVMEPLANLLQAIQFGDVVAANMAQASLVAGSMQANIVSKIAKTTTEGIKSLTQQS